MEKHINQETEGTNIEICVAEELQEYLRKKNVGGTSGQKGLRYEDYFAVLQVALRALGYLQHGVKPTLTGQRPGFFVDDLVIENLATNVLDCFQLRNAEKVSWGTGNRSSLLFDFAQQKTVTASSISLQTNLVNSHEAVCKTLKESIPALIKIHSDVAFFPDNGATTFWMTNELRDALASICSTNNATRDKVEALGRLMLSGWITAPNGSTIDAILNGAQRQGFLRTKFDSADDKIRPEVKTILDKIPNFKYTTDRGFFHYDYLGTRGSLRFDCFSEDFDAVQDWMQKEHPTQFDGELERMLMTWTL